MGLMPFEYLTFAGKNLGDFGVWISGSGTFNAPARDVSFQTIPGRNGDLLFDNGRFENVSVTYPAFISRRFQPRIDDLRAFLTGQIGYQILRDTYHPDEFRQAAFVGGLSVSPTTLNRAGRFNLTFRCKPQRFLDAGAVPLPEFTAAGVIFNPTQFPARPLITVYGTSGSITLNGVTVAVSGITGGSAVIDCDLMEVPGFNKTTILNNGEFPQLDPGENALTFSGFSRVVVTPRFYTI